MKKTKPMDVWQNMAFREDIGLCVYHEGKRVDIQGATIAYPLTNEELRDFCSLLVDNLLKPTGRLPRDVDLSMAPKDIPVGPPIEAKDLTISSIFCRYISLKDFNNYVSKGIFRFANLSFYRHKQFKNFSDPLEGFSFYYLRGRGEAAVVPCYSFYNHALFCGSTDPESKYLTKKFGPVRLILRDIPGFCNAVSRQINAVAHHTYRVLYSSQKIYAVDMPNRRFVDENFRDPRYFSMVRKHAFHGSLFVKTPSYSDESECRISFELSKDLVEPIVIKDLSLLDYFEIIMP